MMSYISAEISFVRAFGNRSLLLILLCALTRTAEDQGKSALVGFSFSINPGIIVVFGPLLALLLLIGLRAESGALRVAREVVLNEATALPSSVKRLDRVIYALFWTPTFAALFMFVEYVLNVVPDAPGRCGYDRWRHFFDTSFQGGTPSVYCMRDVTVGMPWIYPPAQTYVSLLIVAGCALITLSIVRNWRKARGAP